MCKITGSKSAVRIMAVALAFAIIPADNPKKAARKNKNNTQPSTMCGY